MDLKGLLRRLRRNLHLFLDNIEPKTENKNKSLVKTVLKIWSLIGQNLKLKLKHKMSIILVSLLLRNIFQFFI